MDKEQFPIKEVDLYMSRPVHCQKYWYIYIHNNIKIYSTRWYGLTDDEKRFRAGNCFHSKELAQAALDEIKRILKQSDGGWE
jgi:hypothetical protein